jgi:hypothetical protein
MSPDRQPREELSSWKEIAAHLAVSVRTAQMWEKERGLPVRRLPGGNRVIALAAELNDWKLSSPSGSDPEPPAGDVTTDSPTRPKPQGWRTTKFVSAALLIVSVAALAALSWTWRDKPLPAAFRVYGRQIEIFNRDNRKLWSLDYEDELIGQVTTGVKQTLVSIHDLDADGTPEVVVFPSLIAREDRMNQDLLCYSAKGSLLWRYRIEKAARTHDSEFFPPFEIRSFVVLPPDASGRRRVAVTASHYRLFPSQIAILDHAGKLIREYWHGGHINVLKVSGRRLLAAGVSNQTNEATLLVLDPDKLAGASLEDPAHQITGHGPGTEVARILFPRSCMNQKYQTMATVSLLDVTEHEIAVHTVERDDPAATRMWYFNPSLSFRQVTESSIYTKLKSDKNLSPACLSAEVYEPRLIEPPHK